MNFSCKTVRISHFVVHFDAFVSLPTQSRLGTKSSFSVSLAELIPLAHSQACTYYLSPCDNIRDPMTDLYLFQDPQGSSTNQTCGCIITNNLQIGLLPPCNHQQVPFAYKMYTREDETGWNQSNAFKKTFSIDVDIELVGVW